MSKENNSKKKHLAQAPLLTCATEGIKLLVKSVCETVSNPSSVPTPPLPPSPPPPLSKGFEYAP